MSTTESKRGTFALMVAHCAGMVDLVALPIWVGVLIGRYRFDPQMAGAIVTTFLVGAVIASVIVAPRINRFSSRWTATIGFGVSAACFFVAASQQSFAALAILHALSGISAGAALSMTHGTIARSPRPHRLFAMVGIALGVFAIVFLGATPKAVAAAGGPALFVAFGGVMAFSSVVCLVAFPDSRLNRPKIEERSTARIPKAVWFGILGVSAMGLVQSMTFSFLERVGVDRGFGATAITGVLIALGFVNLFPAALAALLEKRWAAEKVMLIGPLLQAGLVAAIMNSNEFLPYALAASVFAAVMIFTHTFAFGLLARLDASGRSMAATPAMLMTGAAIGPVLGGTLVKASGYGSLSVAAVCVGVLAAICFSRVSRSGYQAATAG